MALPGLTVVFVGSTGSARDSARGLRDFGYRVLEAGTADEGISLVQAEKPDLIVCEEPCLLEDGCSLFDGLRASAQNAGTKYLSLTTLSAAVTDNAWEKTERTGYLIKPVYIEQVIMQVRWLIGAPTRAKSLDETVTARTSA